MPNKILSRSVKKKGPSAPNKQISKTKQGVDTAKKMREKIQKMKKDDEEVHSDASDDLEVQEKQFKGAITEDLANADPFFDNENADEKRLRMTKKLIKTLGEEQKNEEKEDFFSGLQANTTADVNIISEEDDRLRKALKYKILEQRDKLFYNIAENYGTEDAEYDRVFLKGHKKAITALDWMPDNKSIITASKDCNLILWDIEHQAKQFFKGEKFNRAIPGHFDEVSAFAISPNGKYLISGGKDRVVRILDTHNQK